MAVLLVSFRNRTRRLEFTVEDIPLLNEMQ